MANKSQCRVDYNPQAISGIAELNDKQVESYQTTAQRLRSDLIYFVPKQWVHDENVKVNGVDHKSNKIFAIGVDKDGNAITAVTLSVNGLRNRHYGKIKENPNLMIKAFQNDDKLWRAVAGTTQEPVFVQGALPLTVIGKKAYINRPFAFSITGRHQCFGVNFTESAPGKWNINHHTVGTDEYVTLTSQTLNEYSEVDNVPNVDANACIANFEAFTADLP